MSHSIFRKTPILALAFFSVCVLAGRQTVAQLEFATFRGKVTDEQGQPIEGASFVLKDLARGTEISFESNNKGTFYRRALKASEYELTIEKEGYQPFKDRLKFAAGEEKRLDFLLGPAVTPAQEAFKRGFAAFGDGDIIKAAAEFEEAVRLAPDMAEAHTNLGLIYLQLNRIDEGISELEKSASLDPGQRRTWLQLGAAYAQGQQVEKAVEAFETALGESPDLSDPLTLEATISLAALYFAAGRVEEAIETYSDALAVRPDSSAALVGLGKCYFNQGDQAKALEHFERALEVAPDASDAEEARMFIEEIKKISQQP